MMKQRIIGLDLVRSVAILFVLSVHFFLNSGYYYVNMSGTSMIFMTAFRWLFFTSVPLFLMLTGFLQNKKKLSKDFYRGIIPVLSSYLFISIATIFVRIFKFHEQKSIMLWIVSIFDFTAVEYAWYVEMFIGIFLLIPFLNLMYHGLDTKKKKLILVLTFLAITALPSFVSVTFGTYKEYKLLPEFWQYLSPFTYYFIGAYISEYGINISKKYIALILALILAYQTYIEYYKSAGLPFFADKYNAYNGFPTVVISVLLFLLLYNIDFKNKAARFVLSNISKASFDIYLASYVFDILAYQILIKKIADPADRFPYYFVVVPIVFVCAFLVSCIRRFVFYVVGKIFSKRQEEQVASDGINAHYVNDIEPDTNVQETKELYADIK